MKRFSAPPAVYQDPSRPPDDDDSDASLSDGSKKVKTAQSFESLFNSESLSDIILDINRGEFVFHAHKMIVGLKSERLAALITSTASMPTDNNCGKPMLYLQEAPECSAVFCRFLYFIYSGAVWLHRDYVVALFKLSIKYGVAALATHCENYIVQLLNRSISQQDSTTISPTPVAAAQQTLPVNTVCDLCEEDGYRHDTRKLAFQVLCRRFSDMVRSERWASCNWVTVRDLLRCDECSSEENLILVSATDWMKRNKIQDKARIQEILSAIRYPRLPRRVLYHLHATASFRKFPPVQDLIDAAIRYHCFRDVPEAQGEFTGLQYRPRGLQRANRNTLCGGELTTTTTTTTSAATPHEYEHCCTIEDHPIQRGSSADQQNHHHQQHQQQQQLTIVNNIASSCHHHHLHHLDNHPLVSGGGGDINANGAPPPAFPDLLNRSSPVRHRSRSYDRHDSITRGSGGDLRSSPRHCSSRRHGTVFDSVSSFHSSCSPVAAVQPRLQGQQIDSPPPPPPSNDHEDRDSLDAIF